MVSVTPGAETVLFAFLPPATVGGTRPLPVFEDLRRSLEEMMLRATKPEDRRAIVNRMKSTLVQAKLGVDDLRDSLAASRRKLENEQRELSTIRRRKELAVGIQDAETVSIAERFERQQEERVLILEQKVAVQTRELEMAERELDTMKVELRNAMSGVGLSGQAGVRSDEPLPDPLEDDPATKTRDEIDSLARERARADREADAARRLDELKRRMGK
jgi:HAMP domain-containing protein